MARLTTFQNQAVAYIETQQVRQGVEADIYAFRDDNSKDLAIVRVAAGHKTPLQRIVRGEKTIEGHVSGQGTLTIIRPDGAQNISTYPSSTETETFIAVDDTMQWSADTDLTFYELCWPPYEDGRFENLD